jgi:hypothetical protein
MLQYQARHPGQVAWNVVMEDMGSIWLHNKLRLRKNTSVISVEVLLALLLD